MAGPPLGQSLFCLLCLLLHFGAVTPHRSLPAGVTCGSQYSNSSHMLHIPDTTISWASYRIVTCVEPIFWLDGEFTADQLIQFTTGTPVLERFSDTRMAVVTIGPGLPPLTASEREKVPLAVLNNIGAGEGAVITESPQDQSTCAHVESGPMQMSTAVVDDRCHFHEEYGDSHSWVLIDSNVRAVETASYRFAVYATTNTAAKLWFACCDWPEDFATPHEIAPTDCPYCGTSDSFGSWASHFYEQKSMADYGGFPSAEVCDVPAEPTLPLPTQCPPVKNTSDGSTPSESCQPGCTNGECHSHNVLGECTYEIRWISPTPLLGNANVNKFIIFTGEKLRFSSAGHMFAHNLMDMHAENKMNACDFAEATEVGNVEELNEGKIISYSSPGTHYYACQIGDHCLIGQHLEVEVKDASEGMKCHDHEVAKSTPASLTCEEGQVIAYVLDNADYGAAANQCSEVCTSSMALNFMPHAQGSCVDAGFDKILEDKQVMPPGSPMAMTVRIWERSELSCEEGDAHAFVIGDANYGATENECSEFCISRMALSFMAGVSEGSCMDAGYTEMVQDKQVQPPGSPMMITVRIMAQKRSCHCHSFEKIDCSASGDALYDEHIRELENYCADVISGDATVCPYKCFQPWEVLHLHYMECDLRPKANVFLQVHDTNLCHKAAAAPDGACDVPQLPTCRDVERTYKSSGCCGNPSKSITIHDVPVTCGELMRHYRNQFCCGEPEKLVPLPSASMDR